VAAGAVLLPDRTVVILVFLENLADIGDRLALVVGQLLAVAFETEIHWLGEKIGSQGGAMRTMAVGTAPGIGHRLVFVFYAGKIGRRLDTLFLVAVNAEFLHRSLEHLIADIRDVWIMTGGAVVFRRRMDIVALGVNLPFQFTVTLVTEVAGCHPEQPLPARFMGIVTNQAGADAGRAVHEFAGKTIVAAVTQLGCSRDEVLFAGLGRTVAAVAALLGKGCVLDFFVGPGRADVEKNDNYDA